MPDKYVRFRLFISLLSEIYSIFLISSNAVACRTWPEFKSRQEKSIIQRVNGLFCTAFEATDEKLTIAPCYCSSMTLLLYNIDAQPTVIYSFIEIKINKPLQERKKKRALGKHQIQEVVPQPQSYLDFAE